MSNFFTFQIYVVSIIFTIIYDAFINNGINYINYVPNNGLMTFLNLLFSFFWGLLIYLANYHNFIILSWILLLFAIFSFIFIIICNFLNIDLYLQDVYITNKNTEKTLSKI